MNPSLPFYILRVTSSTVPFACPLTSEAFPFASPVNSCALPFASPVNACALPIASPVNSFALPFASPATSCVLFFISYAFSFAWLATSLADSSVLAAVEPNVDLTASVADSEKQGSAPSFPGQRGSGCLQKKTTSSVGSPMSGNSRDSPPVSIAFTAAFESLRSAAFSASWVPSTTDRDTKGEVENTRERANGNAFRGSALRSDIVKRWMVYGVKVPE